ncbi:SRPBCC family protein [Devosia nitrariae]|uniref:ATPase n=1 Tax=Devosia nitrariae TaxID=2071872 RepID=A0ABQ5WAF9_9HYPH|nr:SRPBCC family protein [Devosia nitrariae]GLQ56723.1 ATPase [Devosia nitrariae]
MDVDVSNEIVIDRPVEAVARYAMEPDNAPAWYKNIESIVWRTPRPLAVGTQLDFVAWFLGRRLAYTYEIIELVENERMVMRTAQGPFPMETTYAFKPVSPDKTRMRLRNRGRPQGFAGVLAPVMAGAINAANRKDLEAIKTIMESGA